jgi:hypothetical protein
MGVSNCESAELAYSQPGLKGEPGSKDRAFWILKSSVSNCRRTTSLL